MINWSTGVNLTRRTRLAIDVKATTPANRLQLTKPKARDAWASLVGILAEACTVMASYRLLQCLAMSSAMRSCDDNDWPVHSLILSFHDLRGLPLRWVPCTVLCSMIFGSLSWQQTWPSHDNLRRLVVNNKISYRPARTSDCCQTYSFSYVSYVTNKVKRNTTTVGMMVK